MDSSRDNPPDGRERSEARSATFWRPVRSLAWKETRELVRLDQPGRIVLWVLLLAAAAASASDITSAAVRIGAVIVATAVAALGFFAVKLFTVASRRVRDMRAQHEAELLAARIAVDRESAPRVLLPNMTMRRLFFFIDPTVATSKDDPEDPMDSWDRTGLRIKDAASLGQLQVWGRRFDRSGMAEFLGERKPLVALPSGYWEDARFDILAIFTGTDDNDGRYDRPHVSSNTFNFPEYCDLQVDEGQAASLWPEVSPGTELTVDIKLSGIGVEEVSELRGVARVRHQEEAKSVIELYFHRPMTRDYTVTVAGDETVFKRVIAKDAQSVTLDVRGPSSTTFPARVTVLVLGSPLAPVRR